MRTVSRWRRAVEVVAALGAVAVVVAAPSSQAESLSHTHIQADASSTFFPHTASQAAFQDQMRKLWEDHALPDLGPTLQRLQRNQDDLGAAIVPFFGQAAGDQLAALLHEHISVAVELVIAAKAGDEAGVADAQRRWYANGQQIADFLASANPRFWPQETMREAMRMHLDQTLNEAVHRLQGNYSAEIDDYDQAHLHILAMADLLSSGIIQEFPRKFT
jgi:hypothetical protein